MAEVQIRFDDGAAYERMMGTWSRLAGEIFLHWLVPRFSLRWIDVGCGSGALTELIVERHAAVEVQGIDPSDGQLAFARGRPAARVAEFSEGNAMTLPLSADRFDLAVMAVVIFFVPDPAKAVAEMARVVCPGGMAATYVWDVFGGGFPPEPVHAEMRALGLTPLRPPRSDVSRMEALRELWTGAKLDAVEIRQIAVQRTFANFDDFRATSLLAASIGPTVAAMASGDVERLKTRVRAPAGGCVGPHHLRRASQCDHGPRAQIVVRPEMPAVM